MSLKRNIWENYVHVQLQNQKTKDLHEHIYDFIIININITSGDLIDKL